MSGASTCVDVTLGGQFVAINHFIVQNIYNPVCGSVIVHTAIVLGRRSVLGDAAVCDRARSVKAQILEMIIS